MSHQTSMTDRSWWVSFEGEEHGPGSEQEARVTVQQHPRGREFHAFAEGQEDWRPAPEIWPDLFSASPRPPPPLGAAVSPSPASSVNPNLRPLIGGAVAVSLFAVMLALVWDTLPRALTDEPVGLFIIVGGVLLYNFPIIVAGVRRTENGSTVMLVTLLFGWSFVGWAVALIMAFVGPTPTPRANETTIRLVLASLVAVLLLTVGYLGIKAFDQVREPEVRIVYEKAAPVMMAGSKDKDDKDEDDKDEDPPAKARPQGPKMKISPAPNPLANLGDEDEDENDSAVEPIFHEYEGPEELPTWWCACYARRNDAGETVPVTGCRSSKASCKKLEEKATSGSRTILAGSLSSACTAVEGETPLDALGSAEGWFESKTRAGGWVQPNLCALP